MARFKLPPISPLIGSTPSSFVRTMRGRKIERKYYLKTILSSIVVLISALFQWYEKVYFDIRCKKYVLQSDPVFIIGHWRTGTTFLHNILSKDPRMGFVTTYQTVFPNNLLSKFIFKTFMKLMIPEKRPGDNVRLNVKYPQEEEFALTNINPWNYYQFMYFPSDYEEYYAKYIQFENISEKVLRKWKKDYQRLVKKSMINSGGSVPLLKNPSNSGRIKVILEMYPDAKFIFIIRNPVIVFLSSKKFFSELLPTLWFHDMEEADLDEMIFSTFIKLVEDYEKLKSFIPQGNLIEIKFDEFEKEPLAFLEDVYKRFNLSDFNGVKPAFQDYLKSISGYRKNKYALSSELLEKINARWGFAMDRWGYKVPENVELR
jgi:hypothetical protein